jgi:hypothetical protein
MATKKRQPNEHVAYLLPPDLVRRIRIEAAERGMWPAQVVAERLAASYRSKPAPQSLAS